MVKPGTVVTVWASLEAITGAFPIPCRRIPGAKLMAGGNQGAERIMGFMSPGFAKPKAGNQKNAKWRHPHGGSWCSPRSSRIK